MNPDLYAQLMCAYLNDHGAFPITPSQLQAAVEYAEQSTKEAA